MARHRKKAKYTPGRLVSRSLFQSLSSKEVSVPAYPADPVLWHRPVTVRLEPGPMPADEIEHAIADPLRLCAGSSAG